MLTQLAPGVGQLKLRPDRRDLKESDQAATAQRLSLANGGNGERSSKRAVSRCVDYDRTASDDSRYGSNSSRWWHDPVRSEEDDKLLGSRVER
jgi:hypothetical protein